MLTATTGSQSSQLIGLKMVQDVTIGLQLIAKEPRNIAYTELGKNNLPHCRAFERGEEPAVLLRVLRPFTLLFQFLIDLKHKKGNF